jgi:hypothetical protein
MSTASHSLNGGLNRDESGITAKCTCGWVSRGHFTSLAASAAFRDHVEAAAKPQPVD